MKERVRELLENAGLGHYVDGILGLSLNSVRLKPHSADEAELSPGESKIGGSPELPSGVEWPCWTRPAHEFISEKSSRGFLSWITSLFSGKRADTEAQDSDEPEMVDMPLTFIAQIRLSDVAPYDTEKVLPETGMLYFFYDTDYQPWGYDPGDRGGWSVLYYDGDLSVLKRTPQPEGAPRNVQFSACRLSFSSEVTWPSWQSPLLEDLGMSKDEIDLYGEIVTEEFPETAEVELELSRMLGHADEVQSDMLEECQLVSNGLNMGGSVVNDPEKVESLKPYAKQWRLLLQVGSTDDAGMMWGDSGRIYYWIKEGDLKARDFSNTWVMLQCG